MNILKCWLIFKNSLKTNLTVEFESLQHVLIVRYSLEPPHKQNQYFEYFSLKLKEIESLTPLFTFTSGELKSLLYLHFESS